MTKDKEIVKVNPPYGFDRTTKWYTLPGTKLPSKWSIQHEMDAGDLFVAYQGTGQLAHWDAGWSKEEYDYLYNRFRIKYDRRMELDNVDQVFFWEVDKGSEVRETLEKKVDKYIEFSNFLHTEKITVLFTIEGKAGYSNRDSRASWLLDMLATKERGDQFLVTTHQLATLDPLGAVFASPKSGTISLTAL